MQVLISEGWCATWVSEKSQKNDTSHRVMSGAGPSYQRVEIERCFTICSFSQFINLRDSCQANSKKKHHFFDFFVDTCLGIYIYIILYIYISICSHVGKFISKPQKNFYLYDFCFSKWNFKP